MGFMGSVSSLMMFSRLLVKKDILICSLAAQQLLLLDFICLEK